MRRGGERSEKDCGNNRVLPGSEECSRVLKIFDCAGAMDTGAALKLKSTASWIFGRLDGLESYCTDSESLPGRLSEW